MEIGIRSRKRKQRSSEDAFGGVFTRSKSQIYLHRHRSGYARPDSVRNRNRAVKARSSRKSLVEEETSEATVDQITSQVSVKDLRARRVFSPTAITDEVASVGKVVFEADLNVHKASVGNPNVLPLEGDSSHSDLGVPDSVTSYLKASLENIVDHSSVRENDGKEGDVFVQMTPTVPQSDRNKMVEEKCGAASVANEIVDAKASTSKNQPSVASLRGRKKVFKSPSSFGYRRLLPYLTGLGIDDFSNFEIVEGTVSKVQKSSNVVSCKDEEISAASSYRKLADGGSNNDKSCEKQCSNGINPNLVENVESLGLPDAIQKSNEDVPNKTLEECEQMTPPDSEIYSIAKTDKRTDVGTVRNISNESNGSLTASKMVLKPCSRVKVLQTPSSFSHRRLLPFLMSVSRDNSSASKVNQSLKIEKASEENQQPTTLLLEQNVTIDESKTNGKSGQPSTTDGNSDSPTSTLIPIDTSFNTIKTISLVSNDDRLDTVGQDTECSGSTLQLESVDSSIKLEQASPKSKSKCVEEISEGLETLPIIYAEQSIDHANNNVMVSRNINSEEKKKPVDESTHQSLLQIAPLTSPGIYGENLRNGILKRTPLGCRGICNCLNCTSFRLHAERSFEFSRNQMHDAEEVALELIKDLTSLRNILERTASDSNDPAVNEKQVKELCAKALYKEEVARARLAQMNEDLNTHCRSMTMLRPKVTFANKIEEKVISNSKGYGKKSA